MKFITLNSASAFTDAVASISTTERIVVCGSEEDKDYITENLEHSNRSTDKIINKSSSIDVQAWFKSRKEELVAEPELSLAETEGEWRGESDAKQGFTLTFDMLSGQPHASVVGASIATDASWKIPAHFKYGGWNDCPQPELHCAIWQYWQEKYGAQIVGVSNDVIEAYIENPPTTKEEAIELAWEQYLYCYDIVDQGMETIANLGASIINHHAWYFWWD